MSDAIIEPVVRIRCTGPADETRCRGILEAAGLRPESSLSWLVVRGADPDAVNEALVAGGAHGRVAARERIGQLIGWLIDRQGDLGGRARNVRSLVERVVADGGLKERYAPKDDEALVAAAGALYARIVSEGAPFLPWSRFVELFCTSR